MRFDELFSKKSTLSFEERLQLLNDAPGGGLGGPWPTRVVGRIMSDLIEALQDDEKSSRKLTQWLIGLTVVLVVLTAVIAGFTILLAFKK